MSINSTSFQKGNTASTGGKNKHTVELRQAFRESNTDYKDRINWFIWYAENESEQLRALIFAIEMGNGKAPIALSVDLEPKEEQKPVVIEHTGMTQEEVDKAYPHEAKARKERLAKEAKKNGTFHGTVPGLLPLSDG